MELLNNEETALDLVGRLGIERAVKIRKNIEKRINRRAKSKDMFIQDVLSAPEWLVTSCEKHLLGTLNLGLKILDTPQRAKERNLMRREKRRAEIRAKQLAEQRDGNQYNLFLAREVAY